ncbi:MAG: Asp-tRNA(Asn)/Glu-tRNA(Gln) amidotransferase subunit GatB [Burkholderiales bacterium]|nr:Asp-tRNA(Asn)/Glu-tRNA(Gln) amidotransferase subunit GatB [Burkholderiales bacterium]
MAQWEVVIGLETHVQLTTVSKIFSGSSTAFGAAPNTQASVVDLALPGALPVMNKGAAERAVKFGLAIGAKINQRSIFARKNYFYPDLPKGYQISQFETPIVEGGGLTITLDDGSTKFIELTRAHLEEDAGKSVHNEFDGASGVDLNRAGTPLLEIVTEPVMRSAKEAIAYAKTLHNLVRSLDICDGNMQEGSFRCDVNVSVRPLGQKEFGTRREIKNLNSFKFMQQAVDYEVRWQIEQIEDGHKIVQATVLFNPDTGETRAMRTKEDAMDYRYFPDPDLPPLVVSDEMLARIKSTMPELPEAKCARFVSQYALSEYDARLLSQDSATANFYEAATKAGADAKLVANWMLSDLSAALNRDEKTFDQSPVSSAQLSGLIMRISDGTISNKIGKTVFEALWNGEGQSADAVIEAKGLKQISDSGAIEKIVDEVLAKSAAQIADFKSGKEKALMSIVGMVMKASAGKANPAQVNDIVRRKIAAL